MAYDKKSGTITVTGDHQEFERDIFKHFEEVHRQILQQPNCPPEIKNEYEKLKKINQALEFGEKLESISEQARAKNHEQEGFADSDTNLAIPKSGAIMKWIAVGLNSLVIIFLIHRLIKYGVPSASEDDFLFLLVFLATPVTSLLVITRFGGDSWLGLYFKRKALEEKRKIEKLRG